MMNEIVGTREVDLKSVRNAVIEMQKYIYTTLKENFIDMIY